MKILGNIFLNPNCLKFFESSNRRQHEEALNALLRVNPPAITCDPLPTWLNPQYCFSVSANPSEIDSSGLAAEFSVGRVRGGAGGWETGGKLFFLLCLHSNTSSFCHKLVITDSEQFQQQIHGLTNFLISADILWLCEYDHVVMIYVSKTPGLKVKIPKTQSSVLISSHQFKWFSLILRNNKQKLYWIRDNKRVHPLLPSHQIFYRHYQILSQIQLMVEASY